MGEKENFFRLIHIVYTSCEVLRKLLESKFAGRSFQQFLDNNKHIVYHLFQNNTNCCLHNCSHPEKRILNNEQFHSLFLSKSPNPDHNLGWTQKCCCGYEARSIETSDLDFSLLYCLIKNCCKLTFHEITSLEDLREQRNKVYHNKCLGITDQDFNHSWNLIETSTLQISALIDPMFEVDIRNKTAAIKVDPIDESTCMRMLRDIKQTVSDSERRKRKDTCICIGTLLFLVAILGGSVVLLALNEDPELQKIVENTKFVIDEHENNQNQTYVRTKAVDSTLRTLEREHLVIVTGRRGSGKSSIAFQVAAELNIPSVLMLPSMEDIERFTNCKQRRLLILDDIFGKTRPDFTENIHARILNLMRACIARNQIHIIITSRPLHKLSLYFVIYEYFRRSPFDIIIDLDEKHKLSGYEKVTILKSYMLSYNITNFKNTDLYLTFSKNIPEPLQCKSPKFTADERKNLLDDVFYDAISKIETHLGFPLTCLYFCLNRQFRSLDVNFFHNSALLPYIIGDIDQLRRRGKNNPDFAIQYSILVYVLFNSKLDSKHLDDKLLGQIGRVVYPYKEFMYDEQDITDAINDLLDYNVVKEKGYYVFKHQTMREIVAFSFGSLSTDAQRLFVSRCPWNTLIKFARPYSYAGNNNENVIRIRPAFYEELLNRFQTDVFKRNVEKVAKVVLPGITSDTYRQMLHFIFQGKTPDDKASYEIVEARYRLSSSTDYFEKFNETVYDIIQNEMSHSTFLSIDQFGNSFTHYWVIEKFDKRFLFQKIFTEIPELMEITNIDGHTPVHLALYAGWYSIIIEHFYDWFDSFSETFTLHSHDIKVISRSIRWISGSNVYSMARKMIYASCDLLEPDNLHVKKRYLILQNVLACNEVFTVGKNRRKSHLNIHVHDETKFDIQIESEKLSFEFTTKDLEVSMEIILECNRQKQLIFNEFYEQIDSEKISLTMMGSLFKIRDRFESLISSTATHLETNIKLKCSSIFSDKNWFIRLLVYCDEALRYREEFYFEKKLDNFIHFKNVLKH